MSVPLLDLTTRIFPRSRAVKGLQRVLHSVSLFCPEVQALEKKFLKCWALSTQLASPLGQMPCFGVDGAWDRTGDVLCPTFTFFATAGSIARVCCRFLLIPVQSVSTWMSTKRNEESPLKPKRSFPFICLVNRLRSILF